VGTYTYSSLSGYKQYKLIYRVAPSVAATIQITVNGSTSYSWAGIGGVSAAGTTAISLGSTTNIGTNGTIGALGSGTLIIDNADKTIAKDFKFNINNSGASFDTSGVIDTGVITTLTIALSTGVFSSGLIALYGGN
jgi:hypothetical protein